MGGVDVDDGDVKGKIPILPYQMSRTAIVISALNSIRTLYTVCFTAYCLFYSHKSPSH